MDNAKSEQQTLSMIEDEDFPARSARQMKTFDWLAKSAAARTLTTVFYLFFRSKYTLNAQYPILSLQALVAWSFLFLEIGLASIS